LSKENAAGPAIVVTSVVLFPRQLIRPFGSATIIAGGSRPLFPMKENVVAKRTAEAINLKTQSIGEAANAPAHNRQHEQALSPFAMPVAFLVFWPAWIFALEIKSASQRKWRALPQLRNGGGGLLPRDDLCGDNRMVDHMWH
jgi:hypothetical protein